MSKKTGQAVIDAIPQSWLDPLLTVPDRVIKDARACAAHVKSTKKARK